MAVTVLVAVLNAIAALPAIAGYLEKFCQVVIGWWVAKQHNEVLAGISDAAAFAAHASNEGERLIAAQKWKDALSKPRTTA